VINFLAAEFTTSPFLDCTSNDGRLGEECCILVFSTEGEV
jgi:hypothetical protein